MDSELEFASLRMEIRDLLAAALELDDLHVQEETRRDEMHVGEIDRRDELHLAEMGRREDLHAHELELIQAALQTRDQIGQAKGIIMASMRCSADEAFRLLTKQSQAENRKLIDVAIELTSRTQRPYPAEAASPPAEG